MQTVLTFLHVIVCSFLILVVLLQAGKGGGMGIAFGGGGSQTVFGSSGAGNFLTRLTAFCAAIFFINSLALAYLSSKSDSTRLQGKSRSSVERAAQQAATDKVTKDLEKARQEIDKKNATSSTPPASSQSAPPADKAQPRSPKAPPAGGSAPSEKPASPRP